MEDWWMLIIFWNDYIAWLRLLNNTYYITILSRKSFCDSDKKKLKSKEVADFEDDIKLSPFMHDNDEDEHSGKVSNYEWIWS